MNLLEPLLPVSLPFSMRAGGVGELQLLPCRMGTVTGLSAPALDFQRAGELALLLLALLLKAGTFCCTLFAGQGGTRLILNQTTAESCNRHAKREC